MYLQLAEGENNGNYSALAESVFDNYVFIPANFLPEFPKDSYVRADYFTKYDPATASALINALAPYQTQSLNEGLTDAIAFLPVPGAGAVSKGLELAKKFIQKRQQAVAAGTKQPIGKPGGLLDKLKGKLTSGAMAPQKKAVLPEEPVGASVQLPAGSFNVGFQPTAQPAANESFFKKYKTPLLIGGGILVLVGGYMLLKKKK